MCRLNMKKLTLIIIIYLISTNVHSRDKVYDYLFKECMKKETEATKEGATNFCYRHVPDNLYGKDKRRWIKTCYKEEYLNVRNKHRDLDELHCKLDLSDFK